MALKLAVDDMDIIHIKEVEEIVRNLCISYYLIRRSFKSNQARINQLFDNGSITAAIQLMTRVFGLPNGFVKRVGYSAKIKSIAVLRPTSICQLIALLSVLYYFSRQNLTY